MMRRTLAVLTAVLVIVGVLVGVAPLYAKEGAKTAPEVVWLAINTTNYWTNEKNKEWVTKYDLPYPILNDQSGEVGRLYGAKTTPDMRIIDAEGKLAYSGAIDDRGKGKEAVNYVAKGLDEMLAGKKLSSPSTRPYGCSVKYAKGAAKKPAVATVGSPAPTFTLTDQTGKKVSLSDFAGKIVVLEWINPDCPVSRRFYTNGTMKALATKYAAKAPAFALADHTGKKVSLSDFAGKIVVLEWINPDCPYSKRHYTTPTMKNLAAKYAPKGVVWLAINTTHYWTNEKNKEWVTKYDLPYPILNDQSGEVGRAYGAKTTPGMRIIDKSGKVAYSGAIDDDPRGKAESPTNYVAKALDEVLAGKKVSAPRTKPYGCSVKYARKGKK